MLFLKGVSLRVNAIDRVPYLSKTSYLHQQKTFTHYLIVLPQKHFHYMYGSNTKYNVVQFFVLHENWYYPIAMFWGREK